MRRRPVDRPPVSTTPGRRGSRAFKLVDRYFGIPAVALFGLRPKRARPDRIRRIGVMKTAAIGDTLLLAGLLDDLKRAYQNATIVLITGGDNQAAGSLLGDAIDERVSIPLSNPVRAIRTIRRLRLDLLVDCGSWPRVDALLAALSGARFTVGFRTAGQWRHAAYDVAVEHSRMMHERENYVRLIATAGAAASAEPRIVAPHKLSDARLPDSPFVVLHPWPAGYLAQTREWPAERWTRLARSLHERGRRIVVTGSPAERPRTHALVEAMARDGIPAIDAAGQFTLLELADLLAAAEAVVSVNTGVAHLAGLLGARTVSLEGPTSPLRWRPLGPHTRSVFTSYPNCGYLNLGFEYAGQRLDCMDGISVDAVLAAYDDLVSASRSPRPRPTSPELR